ncbi:MAG: thioredoxin-disulfide reductase [Acidobacteriota bacterium]
MSQTDTPAQHARVLILGSGPAGLTAALYNARANLEPLVLEGNQPGGQLTITTDVENFPGFEEGILGPELMDVLRKQAQRFGAQVKFENAIEADFSQRPFRVRTEEATYTADSLIIATGASAKLLGLESESHLMGYGVSACATCDGFFFKDKEVAIVGGGDSAMEEATYLTKFADKVTVIHRREELRASKIMQQRAFDNPKIEFLWNHEVKDVLGSRDGGVQGLRVVHTVSGEESTFDTQGLFLAIGHSPNTAIFAEQLDTDDVGYIQVQSPTTYTNVEGVFACGDAMDPRYRQAVTAAGTGCAAAIDAERWLEDQEHFAEASA